MPVRVSAVVVAGLVALTGAAHARLAAQPSAGFQRLWYQAYDEGVRAVQKGDWPTAIQLLESAKRSGPAPGRRVLFQGDRVDVFNPDFYLGLAYNATKRFKEAEAAFRQVALDKLIVTGDKQYDELTTQTAAASYEGTLADAERALLAGQYGGAERIVARYAGSRLDDGRATELRKRIEAESFRAAAANEAKVAQQPSATNVGTTDTPPEANLPADDPKRAANNAKEPIKEPGNAPADTTGDVVAPPGANNRPPIAKVPGARNAGLANPTRPATPSGRPPVPLTDNEAALLGATAYFEGNYEEAVRVLTPAYMAFPPAHIVTFYWACSKAALVASGRADRTSLTEPREVFASVKNDAGVDRHLRYISPRVREMLGDVPATAR